MIKKLAKRIVTQTARVSFVRDVWLRLAYLWSGNYGSDADFDKAYGVDTSGNLPGYLLGSGVDARIDKQATAYAGISPNVLRIALRAIDDPSSWDFIDIGAGKGRGLIIASEFPYRSILGIELSASLCKVARRNAAIIGRRESVRTAIKVRQGDASNPDLPGNATVVMMYHPFGEELVDKLARSLQSKVGAGKLIVIYLNPVYGRVFDDNGAYSRWYSDSIAEIERSPVEKCAVVMWQIGVDPYRGQSTDKPNASQAKIVVTKPGWKAELLS